MMYNHIKFLNFCTNKNSFLKLIRLYSNHKKIKETLSSIIGKDGQISDSTSQRKQHSQDESYHQNQMPDIVVWPMETEQVMEIMKLCSSERIPVIPYGTGTGLEGGISALEGGVCLNLTLMDKVTAFYPEDFHVTVQPGVTRVSINHYIADSGLWFPVDPGADASLCGMAATAASGTNAVKYGTMKDNVINMEVVLPDGSLLYTNGKDRRFRKSSAGYNLNDLIIGSEGTLGIITASTLKLYGIPDKIAAVVCHFNTIKDAVDCTVNILQYNIDIARVELVDPEYMNAVNHYSNLNYKVAPTLLMEFHGSEKVTEDQINRTKEIIEMNNGSNFQWADKLETRNKLWKARHNAFYALLSMSPGFSTMVTDVCLPITNLTEAVVFARELMDKHNILGGIIGHVGDGNFHCQMNFDPNSKESLNCVKHINEQIVLKALSLNGTCTGEHGVGLGKKHFLKQEKGEIGLKLMKNIKKIFDPLNIMNPGKIL